MYTLGFSFRPWREAKAIADGPAILDYLRETARAYGIDRHIRFGRQVKRASWDSGSSRWTVVYERGVERVIERVTCNFLHMCAGYYNYAQGYRPPFPGEEAFGGLTVHPAALARGPGLRRQAGGGDRQRRDGGDPGPGDGQDRRPM